MATLQQIEKALIAADRAGDADGARKLAAALVAARQDVGNLIPGVEVTRAPSAEPSVVDRVIGAGEAAMQAGTAMTSGAAGMVLGGIGASLDARQKIMSGEMTPLQANKYVEQRSAERAAGWTYQPRTDAGRDASEVVGRAMQQLIPIAGLPMQAAALAQAAKPIAVAAVDAARSVPSAVGQAAQAVSARVGQASQALAEQPAQGRFGSVGAAGADQAAQRIATAQALPVPIPLTRGQATRSFEQLRFEGETAKSPTTGAPLRERAAQQNAALASNFEAMIDATGARAPNVVETGRAVDQALVRAAASKKAEFRAKYKAAEAAGEMEEPVSMAPVVDFLQQNASANAPELAGGVLGLAQRELIRLGGAEVVDGVLVPRDLPLKSVELVRRQVGNAMDSAPANATNMRAGVQLRDVIDRQTEGLGGGLYRDARAARRRYAQLFEDNAIVRDLLRTRRGTADRQVALEDVFRRSIINGDRASVGALRRTLQVAGGEDGAQAWRELQGATLRHMLDAATSNVATDTAGNPIFSAAKLNSAVRALDADGRLDFVLSKQGAQTVRDLNEISKVVTTLPPGSVNTSNTASVLIAAISEAGLTGSLTGLPLPVLSGLRALAVHVKDRRIRQRVQEALRAETAKRRAPTVAPSPTAEEAPTLH